MGNKFFEENHFPETRKELRMARKIASLLDRSKHKKTDREKRKRLLKEEAMRKIVKKHFVRGRVLAISAETIDVQYKGKIYSCVLRGVLKKEFTRVKNLVIVGDFVLFEPEEGSIIFVEERKTILSRAKHLHRRKEHLIAANIDQVLITLSVSEPSLKPALADRYIIAACKGGMEPVILLNKIDLLGRDREKQAIVSAFIRTYRRLGFCMIAVSAKTNEGIDSLKEQMKEKASVFSGQSGTGKSSLINALTGLSLPIGEVIKKTGKGVHTTTMAQLIPLEFGGWCIDTPGIQSFGIWDLHKEDLDIYFPEIQSVGEGCKYSNCTHSHEPDCAVKKEVENGEISSLRYASYLKLLEELA
ncbi:MAG: ribosome small subunit-dependent GTPase A [Chlamydiales bacterium]